MAEQPQVSRPPLEGVDGTQAPEGEAKRVVGIASMGSEGMIASAAPSVYDLAGRLVRNVVSAELAAGDRTITWDLRAEDGSVVPSGTYFVKLASNGVSATRELILTH